MRPPPGPAGTRCPSRQSRAPDTHGWPHGEVYSQALDSIPANRAGSSNERRDHYRRSCHSKSLLPSRGRAQRRPARGRTHRSLEKNDDSAPVLALMPVLRGLATPFLSSQAPPRGCPARGSSSRTLRTWLVDNIWCRYQLEQDPRVSSPVTMPGVTTDFQRRSRLPSTAARWLASPPAARTLRRSRRGPPGGSS